MRFLAACAAIVLLAAFTLRAERRDTLLAADTSSPLAQNARADVDNLSRMQDGAMLRRFVRNGYLVSVAARTRHYYLHAIPAAFRYCRPWTKLFLDGLSRQFYARFETRLRITSLVRTVTRQASLGRVNLNAAAATGSERSSHLTGATLDISKRFMSAEAQAWMRRVLYGLRKKGYVYAIEEFEQPTFHVMVYRNYSQYVATRR
jgi:hypothetical protein